ncbi:hypothetical protein F5144DRAFT_38383 [Chaetomium tenue]|uniref:Uncharacterized protein n=1 Tax=Chaetomium tenue TaxID=1854479 RepID=A0ACB7PMA3_9PEZI|nr:hypothetical protein F5144DRAFT_38383 [Chaetomium globosum]
MVYMRRPCPPTRWRPFLVMTIPLPSVSVLPLARHIRQAGPESSIKMRSESRLVYGTGPCVSFRPPCGGIWDDAMDPPRTRGCLSFSLENPSILAGEQPVWAVSFGLLGFGYPFGIVHGCWPFVYPPGCHDLFRASSDGNEMSYSIENIGWGPRR